MSPAVLFFAPGYPLMIYAVPARNMITRYVSEVPLMDINVVFNQPVNSSKLFVPPCIPQLLE